MKLVSVVLMMFAASAMAKESKEVVNTQVTVNLHEFSCITPVSINETFVQVGGSKPLFLGNVQGVELKHMAATLEGCPMDDLTIINNKAMMGFGFLPNVPVTVTKETTASRINGNGQCIADYFETVQLDLGANLAVGSSVIVKSSKGVLRTATDCN